MKNVKIFIVDANVFLRFLTNDIESQAKRVEDRFMAAEQGKIRLRVLQITIVEILFHLEKWYKLSKKDAIEKVRDLFSPEWIEIDDKDILFSALEDYRRINIDFVDLLMFNHAKKESINLLSFDKDFDKLNLDLREEP